MIKVLVIDDSALVRKLLTEILNTDSEINVVGAATNPNVARRMIKELNPDVLTLDVEMPEMDGLTFLSNLMRLRPMPVVMVSTLTEKGAGVTFRALEMGAIDYITKPKNDFSNSIHEYSSELISKVKVAAKARVRALSLTTPSSDTEIEQRHSVDAILKKPDYHRPFKTTDKLIVIGASTGGTEAIKQVLVGFPVDAPGTVIAQHIPAAFSGPFADRLNSMCAMTVKQATDGEQILNGYVYIAPGDQHLLVERYGAQFICKLNDGPPVNRHKPSVDVLFRSVAQNIGSNAVGVILTGMGNDGAAGLKELQQTGAPTIAQDEKTSVVWGMPGEAVKLDAADEILPLSRIAAATMKQVTQLLETA